MIIQTQNSTYQLSGLGANFEVRRLMGRPGATPMSPVFCDKFTLEVGDRAQFFKDGKIILDTSEVVSVMG